MGSAFPSVLNPTQVAESGIINAIYGDQGVAQAAQGQSQAEATEATGDIGESQQYQLAQASANANAQTALAGGQIQQVQNMRNVMQTIGGQQAGIAAAGFGQSGTALSLAQSSMQQGLLQNQVLGINSQLEAGGYIEQGLASAAEAQAANTAASAATELSSSEASQASIANAAAKTIQGLETENSSGTTELGDRIVSPSNPFII